MTSIPNLGTDRLLLRLPKMDDWPAYEVFMLSERSVYLGGPFPTAAAWGMFCHDTALWTLMGHGAVLDRKVLGQDTTDLVFRHTRP